MNPSSSQPIAANVGRWKAFLRDRFALGGLCFLGGLALLTLLADVLANEAPLYARHEGKAYFPAFSERHAQALWEQVGTASSTKAWKQVKLDAAFWTPVPYGPMEVDRANRGKVSPMASQQFQQRNGAMGPMPLRFWHWLGTDEQGRDLLARMIHGTRVSLGVGVIAVGLAALVGILLGALAAWFGDRRLQLARADVAALLLALPFAYFYGIMLRQFQLKEAAAHHAGAFLGELALSVGIIAGILGVGWGLAWGAKRLGIGRKGVPLPVDTLISRGIEVMHSLPVLLLLLTVAAVFSPSMYVVAVFIGLFSWAGVARFVRAETLRVVQMEYVQAARVLGFSNGRMLWRHTLPNALAPVWIILAFALGNAIIVEATLSFLNLGLGTEVSWGRLLPRNPRDAWWLTLFPGLAIFLTVLAANLLGERLRDVLAPKH